MKNKNIFQISFSAILIFELLSLNAFLIDDLMPYCFFAITFLALLLSFKNLKYGLYLVFAELAIGSLGYLFWFDFAENRISIRIALWLSVMLAWFVKFVFNFKLKDFKKTITLAKNNSYVFWLVLLFLAISFGVVNGYLSGNSLKNIFLDVNGWIFFSLFFPCYHVFVKEDKKKLRKELSLILFSSLVFVSLKTFAILYLFSHDFNFLAEIYRWIRDTRVGEITKMDSGFVRVFFQSHIYVLVAYFAVLLPTVFSDRIRDVYQKKENQVNFFLSSFFLSIIILSYSRSNWVGLFLGLVTLLLILMFLAYQEKGLKASFSKLFHFLSVFASSFLLSIFFIGVIINFPFPKNDAQINAISLVSDRATAVTNEAGASSRWKLLPVLWGEITNSPVIGKGFGATVTYISDDPRVRESSKSGEYTTYAFEWGWLDVWLKIGLLGLLIYITFLFTIIRNFFVENFFHGFCLNDKKTFYLQFSFFLGLIAISGVNVFSPYLNHPLGIGYILLIFFIFDQSLKHRDTKKK